MDASEKTVYTHVLDTENKVLWHHSVRYDDGVIYLLQPPEKYHQDGNMQEYILCEGDTRTVIGQQRLSTPLERRKD